MVVVGAILVIARIRLTAIIGANTRFAPSCLRVTGSRWFGVQSRVREKLMAGQSGSPPSLVKLELTASQLAKRLLLSTSPQQSHS